MAQLHPDLLSYKYINRIPRENDMLPVMSPFGFSIGEVGLVPVPGLPLYMEQVSHEHSARKNEIAF